MNYFIVRKGTYSKTSLQPMTVLKLLKPCLNKNYFFQSGFFPEG